MTEELGKLYDLLLYYLLHPLELPKYYLGNYFKLGIKELIISIIIFFVLFFTTKELYNKKIIYSILFSGYTVSIVQITILGREPFQGLHINLWETYNLLANYDFKHTFVNIIINIIIFIPFGLFLYKKKFFSVLLISFIFVLILELLQIVTCRGVFEICDIIHNTIGSVIGFSTGKLINFIVNKCKMK